MFDLKLALMTGVDIPIPECQLTLHQPTIREISMVGEREFFTGAQVLCMDKGTYIEDENALSEINNLRRNLVDSIYNFYHKNRSIVSRKELFLKKRQK